MADAEQSNVYAEVNEIRRQGLILRNIYDTLHQKWVSSDILAYFAYAMYRIVLEIRRLQAIDLCTLGLEGYPPTLSVIASVIPILDSVIENNLDRAEAVSNQQYDEKKHDQLALIARNQAGHTWKCFLQSTDTWPIYWEANSILALKCFHVVTTPNPTDVIALTQHYLQEDPALRSQIKASDWPPASFVHFHSKFEQLVEKRFSELPEEETPLEVMKMVARRNTMRQEALRGGRRTNISSSAGAASGRDAVAQCCNERSRHAET